MNEWRIGIRLPADAKFLLFAILSGGVLGSTGAADSIPWGEGENARD